MILTDSHCHLHMLDLKEFSGDLNTILENAEKNSVKHLLCVGTTLQDNEKILNITKQYPSVKGSVGLHPDESSEIEPTVEELLKLAAHPNIVAIGETGLDFYREAHKTIPQEDRFRTHIQAAIQCKKPLIIHTRAARQETIRVLKEENASDVGGVFHCFTEDWEMAKAALDLGFYISMSGIVTFKNAVELQEIARKLPLESLLIETDAPFLAPVPHRGKMNQPSYVKHVALCLGLLKGIDIEEIAEHTTQNYLKLFKIVIA